MDRQDLSSHAAWLRSLALNLVRDEHRANDLAQDAMVVALQAPGAARGPLRPWLGGVLKNLVRQNLRGDRRRRDHEFLAHEPREGGTGDQEAERRALIELLLSELERLDEPYRTTLRLRYQEELSPGAIAARSDTPIRTVHTRLTRGLARLRERLDSERGERSWAVFLAPLVGRGRALLSSQAVLAGILVLVAVGIALPFVWPEGRPEAQAAVLPSTSEDVAVLEIDRPRSEDVVDTGRQLGAEPPSTSLAPESLIAAVVNLGGLPVADVQVAFRVADEDEGATSLATSDRAGLVEFPDWNGRPGVLGVRSRSRGPVRWVGLGPLDVGATSVEPTLFVTTPKQWTGRVYDQAGRPLADARVAIHGRLPESLAPNDDGLLRVAHGETNEHGQFTLLHVPTLPELQISASAPGYREAVQPLDPSNNVEIVRLWLGAQAGAEAVLGRVVDERGEPIEGAWVAAGSTWARSTADGGFRLASDELADELHVVAPGRRPVRHARRDPIVEIVVGAPAATLSGRVVDSEGAPVVEASVWVTDPEPFVGDARARFVETAIAGHELRPAMTDDGGRFRFDSLRERDYTLRVVDPHTLGELVVTVRAGVEPVELALPAAELASVAGVVHGAGGRPLGGASVTAFVTALSAPGVDQRLVTRDQVGAAVRTDRTGRFDLGPLTTAEIALLVHLPGKKDTRVRLPAGSARDALTIVAAGPKLVRVAVLDATSEADAFRLLDANGEAIRLVTRGSAAEPDPRTTSFAAPIVGECSDLMFVWDEAVELELLEGSDVLRRMPVQLVTGKLNLFEF